LLSYPLRLFLFAISANAQGTFQFHAEMGGPANDLSQSYAEGYFRLDGAIFSGTLYERGGGGVRITDTAGTLIFNAAQEFAIDGGPNGGVFAGGATWFGESLTDSQIAQLIGGNWYAAMNTPGPPFSPGDQMSGQLQLVPEPSTFAAFGLGLLALASFCRPSRTANFGMPLKEKQLITPGLKEALVSAGRTKSHLTTEL
jgi:hypothetical protein